MVAVFRGPMCQAGPQLYEVCPQLGLTRCRGRALEPLGAADSKDGIPAHLKQGAGVLIDRNVLSLSRSFDVILEYWVDAGDKLAHSGPHFSLVEPYPQSPVARHKPRQYVQHAV
jgi:hypothetical protein